MEPICNPKISFSRQELVDAVIPDGEYKSEFDPFGIALQVESRIYKLFKDRFPDFPHWAQICGEPGWYCGGCMKLMSEVAKK